MNSGRKLHPCSPGPSLVGAASPWSPAPSPECSSARPGGLVQLKLLHWWGAPYTHLSSALPCTLAFAK